MNIRNIRGSNLCLILKTDKFAVNKINSMQFSVIYAFFLKILSQESFFYLRMY